MYLTQSGTTLLGGNVFLQRHNVVQWFDGNNIDTNDG
jgi:hypothetical protein